MYACPLGLIRFQAGFLAAFRMTEICFDNVTWK
jgi:hypothetical protein